MEKQVEKLQLDNYVKFTGWYENIPEILSIIDIFVQNPNYPEGLGISILEAMAMAKPTVITNMGGLAETTLNNETGIIVSDYKPEHLADALEVLVKDRNIAQSMGIKARKRIEAQFDLAKNSQKIDELFYNVING